MSIMTALVLAALFATIGSLIAGITSMATDSKVGHAGSLQWMARRVGFQALALLLIVLALVS